MKIEEGKFYKTYDGRKIGPAVKQNSWFEINGFGYYANGERMSDSTCPTKDTIISEWSEGPIREVVKRELVLGTFGPVKVSGIINSTNEISLGIEHAWLSKAEIREAANILAQIADFLDANK